MTARFRRSPRGERRPGGRRPTATEEEHEEGGERERRGHTERGFRHLDALLERLAEFEANRDRYPTIADFYPRLLDVFREAAERAGSG